jgi:hypothetical protein
LRRPPSVGCPTKARPPLKFPIDEGILQHAFQAVNALGAHSVGRSRRPHSRAASTPATGFEMVWAFRSKVHPEGPVDCLGVGDDPQRGGFPERGQLIVVDVVQLVFGEAEQENRPSGQMPRIGRICPAGLPRRRLYTGGHSAPLYGEEISRWPERCRLWTPCSREQGQRRRTCDREGLRQRANETTILELAEKLHRRVRGRRAGLGRNHAIRLASVLTHL